ncbi:MAG: hypothetical protein H0X38_02450 [Planctomycetes bacterium]|nr:hypothetical protein [Planctomycetota bacterium]
MTTHAADQLRDELREEWLAASECRPDEIVRAQTPEERLLIAAAEAERFAKKLAAHRSMTPEQRREVAERFARIMGRPVVISDPGASA